ncbi:sister-chromatid cohesion protein 3 isoform X2 [Daucus carota subsp. sativus]|uniref:STAG domain-containing protein n=1 Tax=Daucus carota subsp. sativus TaxID=79200 RepID=A0A175YHK8_DAUCS|nr:PREDICTED: sister-chromatid cohesion protein 3-like isoform X2 [Daucus carota subsp. sativus]
MEGTQDAPATASRRPKQVRPKRSKRPRVEASAPEPESHSLIEDIKGNREHIPQVVESWVASYVKDPKPAMVELLTMLVEACGAKYRIQGKFLDKADFNKVVVDLSRLAQDGSMEDYKIFNKGFKNFENNLVLFWGNLVNECKCGLLYDGILFDKCIIEFIIALSSR